MSVSVDQLAIQPLRKTARYCSKTWCFTSRFKEGKFSASKYGLAPITFYPKSLSMSSTSKCKLTCQPHMLWHSSLSYYQRDWVGAARLQVALPANYLQPRLKAADKLLLHCSSSICPKQNSGTGDTAKTTGLIYVVFFLIA